MHHANIPSTWISLAGSIGLVMPSGGSVSFVYGFIFCVLCNVCLSASVGELASLWPTAGGQYHHAYALCTQKWKKSIVSQAMPASRMCSRRIELPRRMGQYCGLAYAEHNRGLLWRYGIKIFAKTSELTSSSSIPCGSCGSRLRRHLPDHPMEHVLDVRGSVHHWRAVEHFRLSHPKPLE